VQIKYTIINVQQYLFKKTKIVSLLTLVNVTAVREAHNTDYFKLE